MNMHIFSIKFHYILMHHVYGKFQQQISLDFAQQY